MKRRSTKQRDIVRRTLGELDHPTADELYDAIRISYPTLGRATVFRNLSVLVEEGLVTRLSQDSAFRYDPVADGHAHFLCRSCGELSDLVCPTPIPSDFDGLIEKATLQYTGLCRNCIRIQKK